MLDTLSQFACLIFSPPSTSPSYPCKEKRQKGKNPITPGKLLLQIISCPGNITKVPSKCSSPPENLLYTRGLGDRKWVKQEALPNISQAIRHNFCEYRKLPFIESDHWSIWLGTVYFDEQHPSRVSSRVRLFPASATWNPLTWAARDWTLEILSVNYMTPKTVSFLYSYISSLWIYQTKYKFFRYIKTTTLWKHNIHYKDKHQTL